MWFPKFPYTNFSQINLDWVLKQIKELSEWMNRYFKDIRQDLDDEINNRIEGDKALGERIDKEITDRTEADQQLQHNIDAEEAAREAADQQLQNNIDTLRSDAILKDGSTTTTAAIPFAQGVQTGSILELSLDAGVSIEAQLDMNSHKITALANGTDNADAVNVGQMNTADAQSVLEAVGEANSYTDSQLEAFAADVHSIPAGGNSGQVLAKVDGTNYNVTWVDQQGGGGTGNVPAGGTTGQVLAKATDADYQTEWVNQTEGLPAGGTEGQVVTKTANGAEWAAAPSGLPAGGTTGQVVTKTDGGAEWADVPSGLPAGGTTGQVVTKTDDGTEWADVPNSNWELVQDLPYFQFFKNGNTIAVYFRRMDSGFFTASPTITTVNGISYKRWIRNFNLDTGLNPDLAPSAGETIRYTGGGIGTEWTIGVNGGRDNFIINVIAVQPYIGKEPTNTPSLGSSPIQVAMYPINRQ